MRYDKDGKEVEKPKQLDQKDPYIEDIHARQNLKEWKEYENALTPQQMAEKIKHFEELHEQSSQIITILENELKDSQQEIERLKEGLDRVIYVAENQSFAPENRVETINTLTKQLLETKQKQEL